MSAFDSEILDLHDQGYSLKAIQSRIYIGESHVAKLTYKRPRKRRRLRSHPLGEGQIRLGARIEAWRQAAEVSQADLALQVKTTRMHLALLEKGQADIPVSLLLRLSEHTGISVGDLLCP